MSITIESLQTEREMYKTKRREHLESAKAFAAAQQRSIDSANACNGAIEAVDKLIADLQPKEAIPAEPADEAQCGEAEPQDRTEGSGKIGPRATWDYISDEPDYKGKAGDQGGD